MLYLFGGESATTLLNVADSDAKWIDIDVVSSERDVLGGWDCISFTYNGQTYTASCDTRYEGYYFLTPRKEDKP